MNFDELTDSDINELLTLPKQISNPKAKWMVKHGHRQKNYTVKGRDGHYDFKVYVRQSDYDADNFSCGLRLIKPDGQTLTLMRCNGANHVHGNIEYKCHIHRANEADILVGRKPESTAEATGEYNTLNEAINFLARKCAIEGLTGDSSQMSLL